MKKFSITLLIALFSLFIIGFGGAATAEAAGNCAETLLVNVSASESTAFTDCHALQTEAARYTGLASVYTNETNVQRALDANAARYTGLAASDAMASWDQVKRLSNRTTYALGTTQPVIVEIESLRLTNPNYFHPGR